MGFDGFKADQLETYRVFIERNADLRANLIARAHMTESDIADCARVFKAYTKMYDARIALDKEEAKVKQLERQLRVAPNALHIEEYRRRDDLWAELLIAQTEFENIPHHAEKLKLYQIDTDTKILNARYQEELDQDRVRKALMRCAA